MKQRILWSSPENRGVVGHSLLPPLLDATQMTHVGVGIDVIFFNGESLTVGILSFFWPVCFTGCVRACVCVCVCVHMCVCLQSPSNQSFCSKLRISEGDCRVA